MNNTGNYVKIEVLDSKKRNRDFWYLDISKLNLKDLIKLREEVKNKSESLGIVLTNIIETESGIIIRGYSLILKKKHN